MVPEETLCGQLMEGSGFTLCIANQPEIKKRTLQQHTLFRKTVPGSVFDREKKKTMAIFKYSAANKAKLNTH